MKRGGGGGNDEWYSFINENQTKSKAYQANHNLISKLTLSLSNFSDLSSSWKDSFNLCSSENGKRKNQTH